MMKIREALENLVFALKEENCCPRRIDIVMEPGSRGAAQIRDLVLGAKMAHVGEWLRKEPAERAMVTDHAWTVLCIGGVDVCLRKQGEP